MFFYLLCALISTSLASDVIVNAYLHCPRQFGTQARVFLMERDFSNTPFEELDPDDTMGYTDVDLNKKFTIAGSEDEVSALDPYLYVLYNCDGTHKEVAFDLPKATYKRNLYTVDIDLSAPSFTVLGPKKQ